MLVNDNFKFATKCEFRSKTWFDIGKLIYKLLEGSEEGYRLWIMYSKMDRENFDEYYCKEYWEYLDLVSEFESIEVEPEPLPDGW